MLGIVLDHRLICVDREVAYGFPIAATFESTQIILYVALFDHPPGLIYVAQSERRPSVASIKRWWAHGQAEHCSTVDTRSAFYVSVPIKQSADQASRVELGGEHNLPASQYSGQ